MQFSVNGMTQKCLKNNHYKIVFGSVRIACFSSTVLGEEVPVHGPNLNLSLIRVLAPTGLPVSQSLAP